MFASGGTMRPIVPRAPIMRMRHGVWSGPSVSNVLVIRER
jgi:hypothetical protein